jgi:polyisoprenyl-phosphate glycosyltransferase
VPKLSVIIPCYFNEANIPLTLPVLLANERTFPEDTDIEYVLVDDGSKDNTLRELLNLQKQYPHKVKVVKLARNVGSYNAILAGMNHATGDCLTIITADLQDPPELMTRMYQYWQKGVKLVIAHRQDREEGWLSRVFSNTFHSLMRRLALPDVPSGGFDYVLFDRQLRDELVRMDEKNTNILYLLTWLGFDYVSIPYTRRKRAVGKSRWTLQKKIKLFIDSFVAFSFFPIRVISITGLLLGFTALLYGIFVIIARLTGLVQLEGWSSVMVVLLFVSSFQMIALGVIGEYVWRSLDASRKRPPYVVDEVYGPETGGRETGERRKGDRKPAGEKYPGTVD